MKKTLKVLKTVGNVLLWVFVAFAVCVTLLVFTAQSDANKVPTIGGKSLINITTTSMEPTIKAGDLIIIERIDDQAKANLKKGDVITFYADLTGAGVNVLNTHRIFDINLSEEGKAVSYITQGDNKDTNPGPDLDPVLFSNIVGQYNGQRYTGVGSVLSFMQKSDGFFLVIVLPLILVFLFELIKFILTLSSVRNKNKKLSSEQEAEIKQRAIEEYLRQQAGESVAESAAQSEQKEVEPAENTVPEEAQVTDDKAE